MRITNFKLQIAKLILIAALLGLAAMPAEAFWPFAKKKVETSISDKRSYDQTSEHIQTSVLGEKTPAPNVGVSGTNNNVTLNLNTNPRYHASSEIGVQASGTATASLEQTYMSKTALPWSVAGLLFVIVGFLVLRLVKAARAYSPAIDAAVGFADREMANLISTFEHSARAETDPAKAATTNSVLVELNKARGKVQSYKPVK